MHLMYGRCWDSQTVQQEDGLERAYIRSGEYKLSDMNGAMCHSAKCSISGMSGANTHVGSELVMGS